MNFIDRIQKLYQDPRYRRDQAFLGGGVAFGTMMTGSSVGAALLGVGLTMAGATLLKSKWDAVMEKRRAEERSFESVPNSVSGIIDTLSRASTFDGIEKAIVTVQEMLPKIINEPQDIIPLQTARRLAHQLEQVVEQHAFEKGQAEVRLKKQHLYELQSEFSFRVRQLFPQLETKGSGERRGLPQKYLWHNVIESYKEFKGNLHQKVIKDPDLFTAQANKTLHHYQNWLMQNKASTNDLENLQTLNRKVVDIIHNPSFQHNAQTNKVSQYAVQLLHAVDPTYIVNDRLLESWNSDARSDLFVEPIDRHRKSNSNAEAGVRMDYSATQEKLLRMKILQREHPRDDGASIIEQLEKQVKELQDIAPLEYMSLDDGFIKNSQERLESAQLFMREAVETHSVEGYKMAINIFQTNLNQVNFVRSYCKGPGIEHSSINPATWANELVQAVAHLEKLNGVTPQTSILRTACEEIKATYAPESQQKNELERSLTELSI